jgi:hypothetical protein
MVKFNLYIRNGKSLTAITNNKIVQFGLVSISIAVTNTWEKQLERERIYSGS